MNENRIHLGNLGPGDVALLKQVADEAAHKAVHQAFMVMGLDIDDPIASQRDFAILRDFSSKASHGELRMDLEWLHKTRNLMEGMVGKALISAIGLAVVGAGHTAWIGIKSLLGRAP